VEPLAAVGVALFGHVIDGRTVRTPFTLLSARLALVDLAVAGTVDDPNDLLARFRLDLQRRIVAVGKQLAGVDDHLSSRARRAPGASPRRRRADPPAVGGSRVVAHQRR